MNYATTLEDLLGLDEDVGWLKEAVLQDNAELCVEDQPYIPTLDIPIKAAAVQPTLAAVPPVANTPPPRTGPAAIYHALSNLDVDALENEAKEIVKSKKVSKRPYAVDILNTVEGLRRNELTPTDLVINAVPVMPAAFRPYSAMGTTFIPGDTNELYGDVHKYRKIYKEMQDTFGDEGAHEAAGSLYQSVKAAYGYGAPVSAKLQTRDLKGPYKEIIGDGPKYSWTSRKMISKPKDHVGRSVVVVDPELKIDEIGLPTKIAWKIFLVATQRRLVQNGMSPVDAAKSIMQRDEHATKALHAVAKNHPVFYSRAPSWHKFNFIAGMPKLIDGDAIAVNPYITTGHNMDFDGDTVNVSAPYHPDTIREAREKLMPSKMLTSIKKNESLVPTIKQEQVLGIASAYHRQAKDKWRFKTEREALSAIESGQVRWSDEIEVEELSN